MKRRSEKSSGETQKKLPAGETARQPVPRAAIPGEFETQETLVFGCGQLVRYFPQLFVDFVRVTHERVQLVGIIAPEWRRLADLLVGAAGLPGDCVEFVCGTTSSVWSRDWSPTFGYDKNGNRCQYYFDRSHMRHRDDVVARKIMQERFPGPAIDVPLTMEGGNFLSNGRGLILTSNTVEHANASRYKRAQISQLIESVFSTNQWAALVQLHGERTGHVDLFATFLAPDFLLLGEVDKYDDKISSDALDNAAAKLDGLSTAAGKLQVARIPMPSSRDTYYRSYNNVIFANKTLLVPTFPAFDPKLDCRVLDMYREYLPGYEVIGIDLGELDKKGGGLHCLSTNVPPQKRAEESPSKS